MKILLFGKYNPDYSRNSVLITGLRSQGIEILECNVKPTSRVWYLKLLWKYLSQRPYYDAMIVPFPGQEVVPLARCVSRAPILFDGFTSHYEGYVLDRKSYSPRSFRGLWYWSIDWLACRLASAVLTDTRAHATYYSQEFGIVSDKLFTVPLGTTITVHEYALPSAEPFIIHFHGSNIPLQGIEYIWEAARLLAGSAIRFQMIGPFVVPQDVSAIVAHQTHVPFSALSGLMARAHVCLGIFGGTEKARRVIPNKVYEALASNRPVITGDTPAIREFLSDTDAVLIPPADGRALADAILRLHSDPQGCRRIADAGTARLLAVATPAIVGAHIKEICEYLTLRT